MRKINRYTCIILTMLIIGVSFIGCDSKDVNSDNKKQESNYGSGGWHKYRINKEKNN